MRFPRDCPERQFSSVADVADPVEVLTRAIRVVERAAPGRHAVAGHLVLMSPKLALALAGTLRQILNLHQPADPPYAWMCATCGEIGQERDCTFPCDTLRVLAQGIQAALSAR